MLYLILSVLSSTLLVLIFKLFKRYQINTFQAILVNYYVCFLLASIVGGEIPFKAGFYEEAWFPYSLCLGVLFIFGFYLFGRTVQLFGIAISSVTQKMSLVITVLFAILFYKEQVNASRLIGIILALLAVILINLPSKKTADPSAPKHKKSILYALPIFVFLSSGAVEILLQYVERSLFVEGQTADQQFIGFLFGTAGIIGTIVFLFGLFQGRAKLEMKSIWAGIALGIPNYGSIFFLLLLIGNGWDGSVVFPVNNVAVISLASLAAIFLFKEKLSYLNLLGLAFSVLAIILVLL